MKASFGNFHLSDAMMRGLEKIGFHEPTPVQHRTIGLIFDKNDLVVQAPTGTGKTGAFGIPVIEGIDPNNNSIQALIVCPTRELALQISDVLRHLATYKESVRIVELYGGVPIERQITALRKRPQIIVATPGRLIDHMNRHTCKLGHVETVILDEADRMLDMGFRNDIDKILSAIPSTRQTVLFSATIPKEILTLAKRYQQNAQTLTINSERPIETVRQYYVSTEDKFPLLLSLLREKNFKLSLVFVATKRRAEQVARQLNKSGFNAGAIHGDLNQSQRDKVMKSYRTRQIDILVATDVAARGIDVHCINAVINYDMPTDVDSYTHRIGRSGRAGERGEAYSFVRFEDQTLLHTIVNKTQAYIQMIGSEPTIVPFTKIEVSKNKPENLVALQKPAQQKNQHTRNSNYRHPHYPKPATEAQ